MRNRDEVQNALDRQRVFSPVVRRCPESTHDLHARAQLRRALLRLARPEGRSKLLSALSLASALR
jgi:hypothetical protein